MPSNARTSAPPSATSPASSAQVSVQMAGSPTKSSAVCFNISTAIDASGRERRRSFSEETDDDYIDSAVGRPSCAAARAPSPSDLRCRRIGTRGPCCRRNCHRARDSELTEKTVINIDDVPLVDRGNGKQFAAKWGRVGSLVGRNGLAAPQHREEYHDGP